MVPSASAHVSYCVQLINMYWSLLQLGRRLVLPAEFVAAPSDMAYQEVLQFHDVERDVEGRLTVNLMFPATEGTIVRLMNAWWDAKVRQPGQGRAAGVPLVNSTHILQQGGRVCDSAWPPGWYGIVWSAVARLRRQCVLCPFTTPGAVSFTRVCKSTGDRCVRPAAMLHVCLIASI